MVLMDTHPCTRLTFHGSRWAPEPPPQDTDGGNIAYPALKIRESRTVSGSHRMHSWIKKIALSPGTVSHSAFSEPLRFARDGAASQAVF